MLIVAFGINTIISNNDKDTQVTVGFLHINDASTAYTANFIEAQKKLEALYGEQVKVISKYNVAEGDEKKVLNELSDFGCDIIFSTSYSYGKAVKEFAAKHPEIEFCQATSSNANEEPFIDNYHTFMGRIYEGRYISGVVAGMKLKEAIENGDITVRQAKIGYVAAYPYPEVISGYTSFFMGVQSIVPQVKMSVINTNTWSNYNLEKRAAQELIDEGCTIISQHSDTMGPAVVCEATDKSVIVYHVGYNQNMIDIAPTTSLTGCRINWTPYITGAVKAVIKEKNIESCVKGTVFHNDICAGFEEEWVQMLEVNKLIAASGTQKKIDELIKDFQKGKINVFKGNYVGTDPFDPTDTYDLNKGYEENQNTSAPTFHYVLNDVITVKDLEDSKASM